MINVTLHPHARARLVERGATEAEVIETVRKGERSAAKYGRTRFRRRFPFNAAWRGRQYAAKEVEAFAVERLGWLVITVIVRYY
jgi:hypothetical protein